MTFDLYEDYDENVEKLIERPEKKFIKSPRYQSIHRSRTKREIARAKSAHKTLGQPNVPLHPPSDFLKKNCRIVPKRPKVNHVHYRRPDYVHELPKWTPAKAKPCATPDVPSLPRDPVTLARLNFIKKNIENAKTFHVKPTDPKFVDTCKGDAHRLIPSGLMPIYIYKENFGQVPAHIKRIKSAILPSNKYDQRAGSKLKTDYTSEASKKSLCRYITEDERAKILKEMKKKWAELMKIYQCLPFLIDTAPKIKRKVTLEKKLKQLEMDIDLIENHAYIYVYDDKSNNH